MNDVTSKWLQTLAACMSGDRVVPQCFHKDGRVGRSTRELNGVSIVFEPRMTLHDAAVEFTARKLSMKFCLGEAWWVLTGSDRLADILPYNKAMARFSDDGITLFGAYGAALAEQKVYAAQKLIADEYSRQAVISMWRRNPDVHGHVKDIPCTLSWQFLIRNGRLDMHVTMRSNDVWLGLPYDIFTTTVVQWYMCLLIKAMGGPSLHPGRTFHTVASMHIYEDDMPKACELIGNVDRLGLSCYFELTECLSFDELLKDNFSPTSFRSLLQQYASATL